MRSERKQEITKAKLKKARQQLNTSANPTQTGGGVVPTPPTKMIPSPAGSSAIMPPPANVPRKAQVVRPAKVAKPRTPPQVAAAGPMKAPPPKSLVTRSKAKNQAASKTVAVTDPEGDTTAPVDAKYDTDELAELPTDSESELVESEPGGENVQNDEQ